MKHIRWASSVAMVAVIATTGVGLGWGPWGPAGDRETTAVDPPALAVAPAAPGKETLRQLAAASSAAPGEVIPPCPSAKAVRQLKERDIEFGPCDPLLNEGEVLVMSEEPPASLDPGRAVCPGVQVRSLDVDVNVPCGVGAEIVDLEYPDDTCVTVRYRAGADAEVAEETFCEAPDARTAHEVGEATRKAPSPGGGNGA